METHTSSAAPWDEVALSHLMGEFPRQLLQNLSRDPRLEMWMPMTPMTHDVVVIVMMATMMKTRIVKNSE